MNFKKPLIVIVLAALVLSMTVGVSEAKSTKSDLNRWCGGADMDQNGGVGGSDFIVLSQEWGSSDCTAPDRCNGADANKDGNVNRIDFMILLESWGTIGCFGG
jgi:hypothetical protein